MFKYAVRKMAEVCEKILKRNGFTGSDVQAFIPHQANKRIIMATADRLSMHPESVIINIDRYGNTTAATIPLAMETALPGRQAQEGRSGAAGFGGSWVHRGGNAVALGVLS